MHRSAPAIPPTVRHNAYQTYVEWADGFVLHAAARPAVGGMRLPSLGVEDYIYYTGERGDPARYRGARPLLPTRRVPTAAELDALRTAVRQNLAAIDAYGDPPPPPATLYRDVEGGLVLALCPWSLARVAKRSQVGRATCPSGSQCLCQQEGPSYAGPLVRETDAARIEAYWHGAACAAADVFGP